MRPEPAIEVASHETASSTRGLPHAPAPSARTIGEYVASVSARLAAAGVPSAAAESRDLLAALADRPRFWPTLSCDEAIEPELLSRFLEACARRERGAPFAYATGHAAFRHLTLLVDERVLIPRPETELLVDLVLSLRSQHSGGIVADIGTGSGAIALALAAEGRFDRVIGTDVSLDALQVAAANLSRMQHALRTPVEFRHGSMLAPLSGERVDVLVSNPPYIAFDEAAALPTSVRSWEPAQALLSADDGLAVTEELVAGAAGVLQEGGLIALEVDCRRADRVARALASRGGFRDIAVHRDLTGRERFVTAIRT